VDPADEPTETDRRAEQRAAIEAALLPVISRALEARRGSPEVVAWVEGEFRRDGGDVAGAGEARASARRIAGRLALLVAECGFAGPLHEQLILTIRAQKAPDPRAE
jgi:hypothetical protein